MYIAVEAVAACAGAVSAWYGNGPGTGTDGHGHPYSSLAKATDLAGFNLFTKFYRFPQYSCYFIFHLKFRDFSIQ